MAAPSAGCLVVDQGDVLLIKIMGGTYGPPGGSVDASESAQCAAERETYEETGVIAHARSWQSDLTMVSISTGVNRFQGVISTLPDR